MNTRREFAMSSAALLVLGGIGALGIGPFGGTAWAEIISSLELMAKGCLLYTSRCV